MELPLFSHTLVRACVPVSMPLHWRVAADRKAPHLCTSVQAACKMYSEVAVVHAHTGASCATQQTNSIHVLLGEREGVHVRLADHYIHFCVWPSVFASY